MKSLIVLVFLFGQSLALILPPPMPCGCRPDLPVCGSDYHTYSSECDLNCNNKGLSVIYRGRCEDLLNNNYQYPIYNYYNTYNPYYRQAYPPWQDPWQQRPPPPPPNPWTLQNPWGVPPGPVPDPWSLPSPPPNPWPLPGPTPESWSLPGPTPNPWPLLISSNPNSFGAEGPTPSGRRSDGPKSEP